MSEAKAILKPVAPLPKAVKVRVEKIQPAHIVDCWRLYDQSLKAQPPNYPSLDEESMDSIRANIFHQMTLPNFMGVIAKVGKRPVGQMMAWVHQRPIGKPRQFLQVVITWVDPAYRKHGVFQTMRKDLFATAKQSGIHHWESMSDPTLTDMFLKVIEGSVVSHRVSGKISLE